MVKAEEERKIAQTNVEKLSQLLKENDRREKEFKAQHDRLIGWAEVFDECDFDTKKMIVRQLVNRITVGSGYDISIELALSMEQYLELSEHDCKIAA